VEEELAAEAERAEAAKEKKRTADEEAKRVEEEAKKDAERATKDAEEKAKRATAAEKRMLLERKKPSSPSSPKRRSDLTPTELANQGRDNRFVSSNAMRERRRQAEKQKFRNLADAKQEAKEAISVTTETKKKAKVLPASFATKAMEATTKVVGNCLGAIGQLEADHQQQDRGPVMIGTNALVALDFDSDSLSQLTSPSPASTAQQPSPSKEFETNGEGLLQKDMPWSFVATTPPNRSAPSPINRSAPSQPTNHATTQPNVSAQPTNNGTGMSLSTALKVLGAAKAPMIVADEGSIASRVRRRNKKTE